MKHFYLVYYFSDTYSNLVRCDSKEDVCKLDLSAPDGSNIHTVRVFLYCHEMSIEEFKFNLSHGL